jgi:hypothetical protein
MVLAILFNHKDTLVWLYENLDLRTSNGSWHGLRYKKILGSIGLTTQSTRRDLVHMDTSAPLWKISKSHTSISLKIMMLKYIGRYLQEECMQKSPVKKYIVFWEL